MLVKGKACKAIEQIADANDSSNWRGWSEGGKNGLMEFVQVLVNCRQSKAQR